MAVQKIENPDGQNMFAWPSGWLRYVYQKKIVDRINRIWKVAVDPNAATSKIEETETDFTLTIGKDVTSGTGIPDPPDKSKTWILGWIPAHDDVAAKPIWIQGPPADSILYVFAAQDSGDYTGSANGAPPFKWIATTLCGA